MRKIKILLLVGILLCNALISLYPNAALASSSIDHNRRELLKSFASVQWGDKPSVYPLFTAAEEGIYRLKGGTHALRVLGVYFPEAELITSREDGRIWWVRLRTGNPVSAWDLTSELIARYGRFNSANRQDGVIHYFWEIGDVGIELKRPTGTPVLPGSVDVVLTVGVKMPRGR